MKLYRFPYSCYARYVQAAFDLAGAAYEIVDVPFAARDELARITGGYILVPVVVRDDGSVLTDSRHILATLVREDARFAALVPPADAGPIWAYADWINTGLEDIAFRLASPRLAHAFATPFEQALFVFVKERKFGPGCVEAWAKSADELFARLQRLLEPTVHTLRVQPFLCGRRATLADAALYGQMVMLDFGAPERVAALAPELLAWKTRLEEKLGPPPYGRIARAHRARIEIERAHGAAALLPRREDLAHIVVRTAQHARACPNEAVLDSERGLLGDRWGAIQGRPKAQLSLMDVRVADALGERDDWCLFGDNLFLDLDLGESSLQVGQRLRVGAALLEITDEPHLGCRKFASRFGHEALRWVNDKSARALHRRGIFARVLEGATVRLGDRVARA